MKITILCIGLYVIALPLSNSIAQPTKSNKELQPDSTVTEIVPITFYTIESKSSGNCLSISQNSKKDNANLIEWKDQIGHNRQFQIIPVSGEWAQLVFRHSDRALAVCDHDKFPVVQLNKTNGEVTHWKLISDNDGYMRLLNRSNRLFLSTRNLVGGQGNGAMLAEKADTDKQKFRIKMTDIVRQRRVIGGELAATAEQIIGKPHPTTKEELTEFLDGTTWSIREGHQNGSEVWKFHFVKPGKMIYEPGKTSVYRSLGPSTMKLWNYDHAVFTPDFNHFRGINHWDGIYHGILLPPQPETAD